MAIKGLSELLKKHKDGELDDAQFEAELGKALPEDWIPKAGLSDEYKAQIDALKAEAKKAEEAHKATIDGMRRDSAINQALASAKARNAKAVRALLDESKLVLNDDGTLSGLKEQLEAVQKDNGYLFEESDHGEGGKPFFGGNGQKGGGSGDALRDAMFSAAGLNVPKG